MSELTHLDKSGAARMVDVSDKAVTAREAVAAGRLRLSNEALNALRSQAAAKGDAVAVARVAGIMAAKRTSDLIPLCHPLPIERIAIDFVYEANAIAVKATVATQDKTGVEMEALTAVSIALLTLYDMGKSLDKSMTIEAVRLLTKFGGKSGDYVRSE
ncbi:cyclic pyranopterin monophosphate synthase MoaC [Sphingomonas tabacisoli]|uniref:Cyclic pyranopterin monophosphate synthase n=1 Tax=Sphingomonas tabacisoli TaxID=2249466 RepID=A0ABW4I3Q0_9SPHN